MVVIFLPTASLTMVWQDRTASPLTWTVQAPPRPAPHPNLVPVICNCSRMAQSSGVSPAASTDLLCPLIFRVAILLLPLPVYVPFTTAAHVGWVAGRPPGKRQLPRRMIALRLRGNPNWNCPRRITFRIACCALRQRRQLKSALRNARIGDRHNAPGRLHTHRRIALQSIVTTGSA